METQSESVEVQRQSAATCPPDVFSYMDYRKYLADYLHYRKSENAQFSMSVFAKRVKVSRTLIALVIANKRNLADDKLAAVAEACHLKGWEASYLVTLALWNQASDAKAKQIYWEKLSALAPNDTFYVLRRDQETIASRWYVLALLEVMRLKDFRLDPDWIAKRFGSRVSSDEIRETIALLEKYELISIQGDAVCVSNDIIVGDGSVITKDLLKAYHAKNIPLAVEAMTKIDSSLREISAMSVGIPVEHIDLFKEKIRAFRKEMLELTAAYKKTDEVYQLNIQFFPLTQSETTEGAQ